MIKPRLKVLVSAYACDPTYGSEEGMGANWVLRLAEHHDIWLITEEKRSAGAMQAYLSDKADLRDRLTIIGVPRTRYGENISFYMYYWTYMLWQRKALKIAKTLDSDIGFDLIHHLNYIGYREPGYLWRLNKPFVWGPVGGHAQMPIRFLSSLGARGAFFYGARNVINWIQMRMSFRVRRAVKNADVLIAATANDQAALENIHKRSVVLLNEQGAVISGSPVQISRYDGRRPLRVVWCGLFFARKALNLALDAVALVRERGYPIELHIVGSGECETLWRKHAKRLEIDSVCYWYGFLPHDRTLKEIRNSDVMLFSSLQEGTPSTVIEAIQSGVPVVCHDACGFGAVINEKCGIKIPMVGPRQSSEGFCNALLSLIVEPEKLSRLARGALHRAEQLRWENKVKVMLDLYDDAVAHRHAHTTR